MHIKPEHLYRLLLNPDDYVHSLYNHDPSLSCGLTWDDQFHPLGQYLVERMYRLTGSKGYCYVTDGVTSFHECNAPYTSIAAINPPWVRMLNRSLRRLSGGEPDREIWPCTALSQLGAALDCEFPESPFAGAEVAWPCYEEGIDDPRDRPYGLTGKLNDWVLDKAVNVSSENIRYVIIQFKRGLLRRSIAFNIPEYFPLHFGFENHRGRTVKEIKITKAFANDISKYIITFDHGQKLAVPNQGPIADDEEAFSNIPF